MTDLSSESKMGAALRSRRRRLKLGLAAALATMALVTPTALARPAGAGAGAAIAHPGHGPSGVSTASATPPATGGSSTFDWGDAAIGAGAALAIVGGLRLGVRRPTPVSRVSPWSATSAR